MSCLDLLTLSQLHDGEAPSAAAADHLAECVDCRARQAHLTAAAREAAWASATDVDASGTRGADCLSPELLSAWVARVLSGPALRAVDDHLESCTACLAEALSVRATLARLDEGRRLTVPLSLQARVAQRWGEPETFSTFVLRLGRRTLALVEQHLVEPLREVHETLLPAPALRAADTAEGLRFTLRAPAFEIEVTALPVDDAVALTLALRDAEGGILTGQRAFLRHHGRPMYSARSDADGSVRLPRIERGVYEVSCPGMGIAFRLDLRGEQ
jgi:hypothetical protein